MYDSRSVGSYDILQKSRIYVDRLQITNIPWAHGQYGQIYSTQMKHVWFQTAFVIFLPGCIAALIGCVITVWWGEHYSSWAAVAGGGKEDALRI